MKIKSRKLISLFLSILMVLSIVPTTVFADYSDINGHWGQTYIQAMADKGSIKGYEDGTFKPDKTISRSEFLAIAIRSTYPDYTPAQAGDNWWAGEYNKAIEKGIIAESEMPRSEMDAPIRREEMTMIMVRCVEGKGETLYGNATGVSRTLGDYYKTGEYYRSFLIKAYSNGLIAGKPGNLFDPQGSATRAEAATVLYRIENKSERVKPTYKPTGSGSTVVDVNASITIYEGQARYNRNAQEGDLFIKKDGTQIVLKKGPNGILGEGQGVAPDVGLLGQIGENGCDSFTYKVADYGSWYDSTGMRLQNETYWINETTGEGYWSAECRALRNKYPAPDRDENPGSYEGQVSSDPYSLYVWDGSDWELNFTCG